MNRLVNKATDVSQKCLSPCPKAGFLKLPGFLQLTDQNMKNLKKTLNLLSHDTKRSSKSAQVTSWNWRIISFVFLLYKRLIVDSTINQLSNSLPVIFPFID